MSTTGTKVYNAIPLNTSVKNEANTLVAINLAINAAWPGIKLVEYKTSVATLVATTFEYSLSAVTPTIPSYTDKGGVAKVFIAEETTYPEVTHRGVRQRWDQSVPAWTLIFPAALTVDYADKTVNIEYQYAHAEITALSDTIYLPQDYLVWYCVMWYAMQKLSESNTDKSTWGQLHRSAEDNVDRAFKKHHTPALPTLGMVGPDRMRA